MVEELVHCEDCKWLDWAYTRIRLVLDEDVAEGQGSSPVFEAHFVTMDENQVEAVEYAVFVADGEEMHHSE